MNKYKAKCSFCGHEIEIETMGKIFKAPRCPKCRGFMRIAAEKYEPEKREVSNGKEET